MMDGNAEARVWMAGRLRQLADEIESKTVIAFTASAAIDVQRLPPAPGEMAERIEPNGMRTLTVVSTTEKRAVGHVESAAQRMETGLCFEGNAPSGGDE